jgi:hypothetical protein
VRKKGGVDKKDLKNLKKRYCLWLYKVTKDELDRVKRKFTQLEIDRFVLAKLKKAKSKSDLSKFIADFQNYISNKESDGLKLKYDGKSLKPEYEFLLLKLEAIEEAVIKEFGKQGLSEIKDLYEEEMQRRILEERQTKT